MRRARRWMLIVCCVIPTLGVSHCEDGDARFFLETGAICGSGARCDLTPIVRAEVVGGCIGHPPVHSTISIGNGFGEILSDDGATITRSLLPWFPPSEARALHDALAAAGAGDLTGADGPGCVSACSFDYAVTFYEPSLVANRAWANAFSGPRCGGDPRLGAVMGVIRDFVNARVEPDPL